MEPLDDYYLWCDHRAGDEAARITQVAHEERLPAIALCGGAYSSEWGFAKLLHWLRHHPGERDRVAAAFEHCDLIAAVLCGVTDPAEAPRSVCAMGHKWMWSAEGEKALRDRWSKVKMPMIVAQFDAQLRDFTNSVKWSAEARKSDEAVLNKPAADSTTVDIDGKQHSLAGYRGKVMVLDFWYRGCSWCIKAMPAIMEVAEHYRDKPVVVLGMNTDHDEKDARFIVDKLKLNYATLKAEGLPEKYSVQGFPTLIIIDQEGIVRERHVSYSPTLLRRTH